MVRTRSTPIKTRLLAPLVLAAVLVLPACAKKPFYRITDLSDGSVFYTKYFNPANARDVGMAKFVDAHTAALIRLEDYEAKRISKKAFRRVLPKD